METVPAFNFMPTKANPEGLAMDACTPAENPSITAAVPAKPVFASPSWGGLCNHAHQPKMFQEQKSRGSLSSGW